MVRACGISSTLNEVSAGSTLSRIISLTRTSNYDNSKVCCVVIFSALVILTVGLAGHGNWREEGFGVNWQLLTAIKIMF